MNLESFSFYNELEPQTKDFLQMSLKPISVPKDSILFFQGDICDRILVKELSHNSHVYQSYLFSIYTLRMTDLTQLINDIKFKNLEMKKR